ncbi:hypothetical protein [Bacillus toyonensis]|uniref:hypothetical protein n=1 Tax=Bacillus toyonensis TaxID=155322 RepID=UPI000BF8FAF5|nr:hypothetical protein [Bacillus toyonensis]PFY52033.1 hypothetical protein COL55_03125 [Bacillus toyonensis]PFY77698.1 hypothetical protein COL62_22025 [Bacillus toyonensis]PHA46061.1 hypothetical protein COE68_07940 [Bacillus toyonensis]
MSIKDNFDLLHIPEDIRDTVGGLLKDGHEIVDTLSECSPYLSFANTLMNKRREYKCKVFLQGLGMKVLAKEEITSDDLLELGKLLNKSANKVLVLDILEEATKTVSDISPKILGIIAGQVMEEERQFNYNDWILINGLKNMNNWDFENLKKVYLYFESYPHEEYVNSTCIYLDLPMYEYSDTTDPAILNLVNDDDFQMFKSSIMRINNLQILSNGAGLMDDDATSLRGNRVGDELYELIKVIGL